MWKGAAPTLKKSETTTKKRPRKETRVLDETVVRVLARHSREVVPELK
jgi:hypothetical protein